MIFSDESILQVTHTNTMNNRNNIRIAVFLLFMSICFSLIMTSCENSSSLDNTAANAGSDAETLLTPETLLNDEGNNSYEDRVKHIDMFYALDFMFLAWCQKTGYVPSTVDLNQMQGDYVFLFGCTEDGNNIAFMDYYGIPKEAYITYWTRKQELAAGDAKSNAEFNEDFKIEMNFDAWFSDDIIPADQPVFINPSYKYNDPVSVFVRCETDEHHTNRYYTINGFLIEYVGKDKFSEFHDKYAGTEDFNILNFIDYFDISREQFDSIYGSENYHSIAVPYKSEYLYGADELKDLYFVRHPIDL